jgi:hypothetical protein
VTAIDGMKDSFVRGVWSGLNFKLPFFGQPSTSRSHEYGHQRSGDASDQQESDSSEYYSSDDGDTSIQKIFEQAKVCRMEI